MTTRRRLLRAAGVAGAGGLATLAGLRAGSAPSRAAAELAITSDETTLGPDGDVAAVRLAAEIEWSHDLPEGAAPETVGVTVRAGRADAGLTVVAEREASSLFPESNGVESVDVDLLDAGALEPAAVAPEAGAETTVPVEVVAGVVVETSDGETLAEAEASDTADVVVARERGGEASVGGSGALTVETGE
jgi:hypothetical protein